MKRYRMILSAALAAVALVSGCSSSSKPKEKMTDVFIPEEREENRAIVNNAFEEQSRSGAVTSRTIYPHHFEQDAPELNSVGKRRLDALTTHAPGMPVEIQVPRGDASDALYDKRLASLRARLVQDGVDPQLVTFAEGKLPSGDGIASDRVNLLAVEERSDRQQSQTSNRRSSAGNSGYGSGMGSGSGGGSGSRSGGGGSGGGSSGGGGY